MMTAMPQHQVLEQVTGKAIEAFALWADTNQRILRELVDFSASTAKEGVRLYGELQSASIAAAKETQAYLVRRQREWQETPSDPMSFYQRSVIDSVEGVQKVFKILEGGTQAITRSAERLQVTADQVGKDIQSAFTDLTGKTKSFYTPAA
jgi:hypothetical protein